MFQELITDELLAEFCRRFKTTLTHAQGDAWRLIAAECDALAIDDARMVAYILGTCWHECRFKSIKEIRAKIGTPVWKMQERYWHTNFMGRGYPQLTWRYNYRKFSKIVGRDLVKYPDDVLIPAVGAKILVVGMYTGMFSGVGLKRYFTTTNADWYNARRIVNGMFQTEKVAQAAIKILDLLQTPQV